MTVASKPEFDAEPKPHEHHPDAEQKGDGHVHLHLAPTADAAEPGKAGKPAWDWARWVVVLLALGAAGLIALSFFHPWWRFWFYAPQYPRHGLKLVISLTGVTGDVSEINILNHYIGMKGLDQAAQLERRLAGQGVGAIAIASVAAALLFGKKLNKLVLLPALAFPLVFLADSYYWMYRFGHELDPKAPIRIKPFTPELFGNGQVAQFGTFATPALGFWLAVGGFLLVLAAVLLRQKVCDNCGRASTCSVVCPRGLVIPERKRGA